MENTLKKLVFVLYVLFALAFVGCYNIDDLNHSANASYLPTTPEKIDKTAPEVTPENSFVIITPSPTNTPSIAESTPEVALPEPSQTIETVKENQNEIKDENKIVPEATSPLAKEPEGIFIGSDEYYNFYLSNNKIYSFHWNGTEEDNDTFLYDNYLYFESEKGIYRVKTDGTNIELLIDNGTGHFGYTWMTITKVEEGTLFFIRYAYTGVHECRLRITDDTNWASPVTFGQIDASNKFCFNDEGLICLLQVINEDLVLLKPFTEDPADAGDVPIIYQGYLYFTYNTDIYRVTPEGTGFECILDAEGYIVVEKIESDILYYDEVFEGGRERISKQIEIEYESPN